MHALAKERGGECLSTKYINTRTKLKWQCAKGHIWDAQYSTIRRGSWCPTCAGQKKKIKQSTNQILFDTIKYCWCGGTVYTEDSKFSVARHVGSTPTTSRYLNIQTSIYFVSQNKCL